MSNELDSDKSDEEKDYLFPPEEYDCSSQDNEQIENKDNNKNDHEENTDQLLLPVHCFIVYPGKPGKGNYSPQTYVFDTKKECITFAIAFLCSSIRKLCNEQPQTFRPESSYVVDNDNDYLYFLSVSLINKSMVLSKIQ